MALSFDDLVQYYVEIRDEQLIDDLYEEDLNCLSAQEFDDFTEDD